MISGMIFMLSGVLVILTTATDAAAVTEESIEIGGRILALEQGENTTEDAKTHVNQYGEKLHYGHNLPKVFGVLTEMQEGDYFTVSREGEMEKYQVKEKVVFDKVSAQVLVLNG